MGVLYSIQYRYEGKPGVVAWKLETKFCSKYLILLLMLGKPDLYSMISSAMKIQLLSGQLMISSSFHCTFWMVFCRPVSI